jgi:hypothetical protein
LLVSPQFRFFMLCLLHGNFKRSAKNLISCWIFRLAGRFYKFKIMISGKVKSILTQKCWYANSRFSFHWISKGNYFKLFLIIKVKTFIKANTLLTKNIDLIDQKENAKKLTKITAFENRAFNYVSLIKKTIGFIPNKI